ncbi:MAG: hypothetical protein C4K49_01575 [Candidatus Thorarchaeota archaeon]|nr:MAG: hypothetical protein C4K49_01575 [Candidatus Thorarchaeota archaeon]
MSSFAGAVIFPDLRKTVLFKNSDSVEGQRKDEVSYDVDSFGIRGVDMSTGAFTGLGIGVNRHGLTVADTHVRSTSDPSYHTLTEQVLMFAKDAEDGLTMVLDHLKKGRNYQWGNLVLADNDSMLVIEIAGNQQAVEWSERKVLRTGHHIMLETAESLAASEPSGGTGSYADSVKRVERGYELIKRVSDMKSVFALLKDHGESKGQASVCKHSTSAGQPSTVASYVVEIDHQRESTRPRAVFHVAKGNPCSSSYTAIPLIFPADDEIMKRARTMYFK